MRKIRIMLENPENAGNIGTVIRNIYAFDSGVLFLPRTAELNLNVGSACGTGHKCQIQKFDNAIEFLKETKFRKIGFVVNQKFEYPSSEPIYNFKTGEGKTELKGFQDNDLLIFGNEANGLTKEAIALCDKLVTIPMLGHMACLNVANTTGIALYEVLRQKIEKGCIVLPLKPKLSKLDKINAQMEVKK